MSKILRSIFFSFLVLAAAMCYAQAPSISYTTPQSYKAGIAISSLSPTNSGGEVPLRTPVTIGSGFSNLTSVSLDSKGNVYIVANGSNTVLKIPAFGGSPVTLGSGFNLPAGVAIDSTGNVFVTDFGNNLVKKIPAGGGSIVHVGTGFSSPYGIAADKFGNIYVSDRGSNTIKKVTPAGTTTTYASGFNTPTGVAVDSAGNVYVTDRGNNAIKKIAPGGTITTVGNGSGNPNGVAVDAAGNVYFADTNNSAIIEIPQSGGATIAIGSGFLTPTAVASNFAGDIYVADNGNSAVKKVPFGAYTIAPALPGGLNFDTATGIISGIPTAASPAIDYTVTAYNSFGSSTTIVNIAVIAQGPQISYSTPQSYTTQIAISPLSPVNTGTSVPSGGYSITPALPSGLAFNVNTGTISGRPVKVSPSTSYTVTATNQYGSSTAIVDITVNHYPFPQVSYQGPQTYFVNDTIPPLTPASSNVGTPGSIAIVTAASNINSPRHITTDTAGNIYFSQFADNLVKKIPAGGGKPVVIGTGFNGPVGLAVDKQGNVYVADDNNNVIKKIPVGGGVASIVASGFNQPYGLAIDGAGNLYVTNLGSGLLQKIPAGGGAATQIGPVFSHPTGVALDDKGNIYISDNLTNLVQKIPAGSNTAITLASNVNDPYGVAVDGEGNVYYAELYSTAIKEIPVSGGATVSIGSGLNYPQGLAIDKNNILYIPDFYNNAIKEFVPTGGYAIAPGLPPGLKFDHATGTISGVPSAPSKPSDYTVTAYNIGGFITSTVNIKVGSSNTILATIALTPKATLTSSTGPGYKNYTATVPNSVDSIRVTPTAQDPNAMITVNNIAVQSGMQSQPVKLFAGNNGVNVVVTAADGSNAKSYFINVIRNGSADATLSNVTLSTGTLSPAFASGTTSYTAIVPYATASIKITPTYTVFESIASINGVPVPSGKPSGALPLNVGENTIVIDVHAQDAVHTQSYTITVTRAAANLSTNAVLSVLSLTPKTTLTAATGPGYKNYNASVLNGVSSIQVTPTAQDATAAITVNGQATVSGALSQVIPLNAGTNAINISVTAQDGATVKNYIITITRAASAIATLSNLAVSAGSLNPAFTTGSASYTEIVPNATASIKLTPTATDPTATIKVNGVTIASGSASAAISLMAGTNTITTVVTAADTVHTQTYTLTVTRAAANLSTNAVLNVLSLTPKTTLTATAGPGYKNYSATVPNTLSSIQVTPTAQDTNATIKINGIALKSGTLSQAIPLNPGTNTINVMVTAQDSATVKNYIITVTRPASAIASLSGLAISAGTLNPVFATASTSYTAIVPYATASIKLIPTLTDTTATIKVDGTAVASGSASQAIALAAGSNTITTVVTAQNGTTTQTYTLTVTRAAANLSTNAVLSVIALTPKTTLTATTGAGYKNYTASVANTISSVQVTPTAQDVTATITVNGIAVTSGTLSQAIPLAVGANIITTVVTAQDGATIKSYIITVTRAAASGLAMKYDEPAASPVQAAGVTVHQGLSPNGDGDNDVLTIDGITNYPENTLQIMSRSGELVYHVKGYDNRNKAFDGTSNLNGKLQPAGTYFYSLDYKDGGETKHKTGFIVLKY